MHDILMTTAILSSLDHHQITVNIIDIVDTLVILNNSCI